MTNNKPSDLITVTEARHLLGISRMKIAQMIRSEQLRHFPNPLDARMKLVSRAEVVALKPQLAEAA